MVFPGFSWLCSENFTVGDDIFEQGSKPMIVSSPLFTQPEMWRGVVKRNIDLLRDTAYEFFLPGEGLAIEPDADGLGVDVIVASLQPEVLLKEINKRAFRNFAFRGIRLDENGWYRTHFRAM